MRANVVRAVTKICTWFGCVAASFLLSSAFASTSYAQAVVEAAGTTSVSAGVGTGIKAVIPKIPDLKGAGGAAGSSGASPHLIATNAPPPQETNVRDFQTHAGKDAGKVLLRATPVEAEIWVNGKIVGKTPMLLVLAPGKYQVEMRGARGETGTGYVDLLPHESREVLIKLEQLYPGRVTA